MGSIFTNESIQEIPSETTQLNHLEDFTTIIEQNGDKYFGEIKDNNRHGYGICIYFNHEFIIPYIAMPDATDTLKDSFLPFIGISTNRSIIS